MRNKEDIPLIEKTFFLQFFISSKYRLYRHLLPIAFISLALFKSAPFFTEPALTFSRIVALLLFLLVVYTNMYLLVPKFLFKHKYVAYNLSVVGIIAISALIYWAGWIFFCQYVRLEVKKQELNLLPFSFVILIFISASREIKLFQRSIIDSRRIDELEKTTMNSEMQQLKNQISPHFLFNMLNNVNVLTQRDPEKASQVLVKLSDLLRYQLYDSTRNKVFLTADIHFLEDFLNLEKIRRDNFEFLVSKEGELSGLQISPLLFITFVENAVKHSMDAERASYVYLYFDLNGDNLRFKCINSKPQMAAVKNDSSGLGLANVKRRLELLYPLTSSLLIEENKNTYTVNLTIQL